MIGIAAPAFIVLMLGAGFVWFLHSRRQYRRIVPSLTLWRQLQTSGGIKPKSRLIPPITLSLVLQLLAVLLLTAALTQPFWGARPVPDHLIVVMDTGGAMRATENGASVSERAKDALSERFGGAFRPMPTRLSVIAAGTTARYVAARWSWEDGILASGLEMLSPTDGSANWRQAASLVPSLIQANEHTEIVLVSANPMPDPFIAAAPQAVVSELTLSPAGLDAGISATLALEDAESNIWRLEGEAYIADDRETLTIAVQYASDSGRTPLDWATIVLEPAEQAQQVLTFSQRLELPGPGIVTAFIPGDATPQNNRLRFVADATPKILDVLYVGPDEQPLLRALDSVGNVRIFRDDTLDHNAGQFDLVVTESAFPQALPATNIISIEHSDTPLDSADPDDWSTSHPLSRDMDWGALEIGSASGIDTQKDEAVLLSSRGSALVTAKATESGRLIRIGFDLRQSNWPQTSNFPIFVANLIDWMGTDPANTQTASCTVGMPCPLDARLLGQPLVNLEAPGASQQSVPEATFIPTQGGLYRVGQGHLTQLVAVNAGLNPPSPSEKAKRSDSAAELPRGLAMWLLGAALVVLVVEALVTTRGRISLALPSSLRAVGLLLLAAALLNAPWPWIERSGAVVVILPQSMDVLADDGVGIARTKQAIVTAGPTATILADMGALVRTEPQAMRVTHTASAIELAAAMIPSNANGHIVLAADAAPDSDLARRLAGRGLVVDYIEPAQLTGSEIYLSQLDIPQQAMPGEAVPMTAFVHSVEARTVKMDILANGETVASQEISLASGPNRVEAVLPAIEAGENLVEFRLAEDDPFPQNNAIGRLLTSAPLRPVAIVSADPAHGEAFARLIEGQGLEARVLEPHRAPHYLKGWLEFGNIVLVNTPALALTSRQQSLIESATRDHGVGLTLLGGPNSFGPGGYFGTPLESLSPLSSRVPQDAPEVAMIFVLDRSGSMQQPVGDGNRLDVAKSATLAATELLNPQSQVGIIAFDAEARVLLPLTRLEEEPGAVQTALEGFDPGGGTSIYPGLVAALAMIEGVDAPAKHVVVMTDGLSQPGDFPGVVRHLRAEGATVSAVAIGEGADTGVAHTIADLGGGSVHVTSDFAALPSILSQEAMLLASPIKEEANRPVWHDQSAGFLAALPAPLPPLEGFVGTTAKPEAQLAIRTTDSEGRDMPILAYWRYGNGMVLAMATDTTGPWSEAWQALPQYGAFWNDILLQFQATTPRPGLTLTTASDGDYLELRVSALDEEGQPLSGQSLKARVTAPQEQEADEIMLVETRPGLYEGRRVLDRPGRYGLSIEQGEDAEAVEAAYFHSYDGRYDFSRSGGAKALAHATGGTVVTPDQITSLGAGISLGWQRYWPLWALLGFAAFMFDLTVRYRGFPPRHKAVAAHSPSDLPRRGAQTS